MAIEILLDTRMTPERLEWRAQQCVTNLRDLASDFRSGMMDECNYDAALELCKREPNNKTARAIKKKFGWN